MGTIKQIYALLFGRFKTDTFFDFILNIFRIIYFIILLPAFIFAVLLSIRSGLGEEKRKIGIVKKVLFHIAMLFWSLVGWALIIQAIKGV